MPGGSGQALPRPGQIDDILCLCLRAQRIACRVYTVRCGKLVLQLPAGPNHPIASRHTSGPTSTPTAAPCGEVNGDLNRSVQFMC